MSTAGASSTALVTGGSRGIGLAVARALVREGVRVAIVARGAEELERRRVELGHETVAVSGDVSDATEVERIADTVHAAFGDVPDILINNAGIFIPKALDVLSAGEFERMVRINLVAPFLLLRAMLPAWKARGRGHLITLGSVADRTIYPDNGGYSASKFGLRAMHEAMRGETRGSGVRATLVSPASTDTPIWDTVALAPGNRFPARSEMLSADAVAQAVAWAATRPADVNIDELRLSAS